MRPRPALAALLIPALLLLGCSASGGEDGKDDGPTTTEAGGDDPTTTEAPDTTLPDDADAALAEAADATLAVESFTISAEAALALGPQQFGYGANGSVSYADPPITALTIDVNQNGQTSEVEQRTDGETIWVRAEGPQAPTIPDDKTWIAGDASILSESDSLEPIGLVGVVVALRAASDTTAEAGEEIDGVPTTHYTSTISYEEAVEKAGAEEDGFTSALSLTSPEDPILSVEAWVGDDGIVRRLAVVVEEGSNPNAPTGTYDLELTDVNQEVSAPEAPAADDTLTGAQAEELLGQLVD